MCMTCLNMNFHQVTASAIQSFFTIVFELVYSLVYSLVLQDVSFLQIFFHDAIFFYNVNFLRYVELSSDLLFIDTMSLVRSF